MKNKAHYPFRETPFQCHRWYHGAVERPVSLSPLYELSVSSLFVSIVIGCHAIVLIVSRCHSVAQEAEARLMAAPMNGRFLVRRKTGEDNSFVISLIVDTKIYHNLVSWSV
jgi:hypothetical protein